MKVDSRMPKGAALSIALTVALLAGATATEAQAATLADAGAPSPSQATLSRPADYKGDGFASLQDWHASMSAKRDSLGVRAQILLNMYGDYANDDQRAVLDGCVNGSGELSSMAEVDAKSAELDEMRASLEEAKRTALEKAAEEAAAAEAALAAVPAVDAQGSAVSYASYSSGSGLTRASGVNNFGGRRETYYSSNALYHYRTGEWTQDSEGFWRDADGYYVVAASDMAQGSVFAGSKGDCKVYDSGCAAGTTDYYTGW